jgi:hypothetical protein
LRLANALQSLSQSVVNRNSIRLERIQILFRQLNEPSARRRGCHRQASVGWMGCIRFGLSLKRQHIGNGPADDLLGKRKKTARQSAGVQGIT